MRLPKIARQLRPFYAHTNVPALTDEDRKRGVRMKRTAWTGPFITLAGPCQTAPVILSDGWNVRVRGFGDAMLIKAYSV